MSEAGSPVEPLQMTFDVNCSPAHAFAAWTAGINAWWPPDHTVSGQADAIVVLEEGVGGRIYERTADGAEHAWGEILVWNPPIQLVYLWHLRRDRADATEVEVRFVPHGAATRVEIEHRGWERPGTSAETWRDRNRMGWQTLMPHFLAAVAGGAHRW